LKNIRHPISRRTEIDMTFEIRIETGNDIEQRRLPATRRPGENNERSRRNLERNIPQHKLRRAFADGRKDLPLDLDMDRLQRCSVRRFV
jgi:hypothetical protein